MRLHNLMKKASIGNKIAISFSVVIILLTIISLITLKNTKRLGEDYEWVGHTHEVLGKLEMVLGDLKDAETGQRGFIITGMENYLEPYNTALKSVHEDISDLKKLTIDNKIQQQQIIKLNALITKKFDELETTINKRRISFEDARKIVISDGGKEIMDDIRSIVIEMTNLENELLIKRKILSDSNSKNAINATIWITIGAFAFVIILVIYFTRIIAFPIKKLSIIAKKIAIGDLKGKLIKTDRKDEIGILAESFILMQQYMREKARQANQIANGNLGIKVKPLSNNDTMGVAFSEMLNNLHSYRKNQDQNIRTIEQKEKYLQTVLNSTVDAIITIDEKGIVEEFNQAAERIFQYNAKEVIGQNVKMITNLHDRKYHDQYLRNYKDKGKAKIIGFAREVIGIKKDGTNIPLRLAVNEFYIGDQRKFVGMMQDLTESKNRTEELEKSKNDAIRIMQDANIQRDRAEKALIELKKLSLAVEGSPVSVIITNKVGIIEYVNPKFTQITGYTLNEVLGKSTNILNSGIQPKQFYKDLWETILEGKDWHGEFSNRKKNGEIFWESASISSIYSDNNEITNFIAIKEDITNKKRDEKELERAKEAAEVANQTKSEFLANMSHEIRTPMNAVIGFADLLSLKLKDPQLSSYVDSIKSSGKSLLILINDILDLSKIEAGKLSLQKEFIDLRSLINDIKNILSLKIKENTLDLIINIDVNLPRLIYLDETRTRQILINLIGNAIKFTEEGFIKVTIFSKASIQKEKNKESTINLVIEVEDSGLGIEKENLEKIFETFTQADQQSTKQYGGTGLGLPISKKLVEIMGGSLTVSSELGKGSTFTICLNAVRFSSYSDDEFISTKLIDPEHITFEKSKVLIIDDIETNLLYLSGALELASLEIIEALNGKEGLQKAYEFKPDLIITDLKMPIMTGYELINYIREDKQLKGTPVIAMSASAMKKSQIEIKKYDFNAFLIKPVQLDLLFNELIKYLPHTILTEDILSDSFDSFILEESDLQKNTEEIYRILREDIKPLWEELKEQQPMDKVEIFANRVGEIGEQKKITPLSNYANVLNNCIDNFDVIKMLKTLKQFPALLKQFKNAMVSKSK